MSSIDQRVVQMEFDNKQFEKGIQTTLKSLDQLQKGLDLKGATNGIKNIEKSINNMDISGIGKTVESIASHFTWLGRTVDNIIDNLTSRIINLGSSFVKSMSIDQVFSGWDKYGEKVKSVATIMNATGLSIEEVNTSLEKLNWFTDETSYNYTDMVNNIGKFTAVDVPLNDAVTAMQGIANAAALSGQGVNEASRAMYNFSQAMGTGALLLQDWKSIELANMATTEFKNQLIQSGLAVGTLVQKGGKFVTTTKDGTGSILSFTSASEGFRDSLAARWITTDVMMDTFKKYGEYADEIYKITQEEGITAAEAMERFSDSSMDLGERAFKAAQEYRTFTDAIMATKDAVSTGWMQSFEIIFGDYEKAKELWTGLGNTLWDVFASGTEARNQMLKDVFEPGERTLGRKDWLNLVKEGIADEAFEKALTDAARTHGVAIDEMIKKNGTFYDSLRENWLTVDILNEALDTTKKSSDGAGGSIESVSDRLEELKGVAKKVIRGDFGNGEKRMKALAEAGYDYSEVQGLVNKILKGTEITIDDLSDAELKQLGYTEEEIAQLNKLKKQAEETGTPLNELIERMSKPTGRELMVQSAANAFEALMRVIRAVKYAWKDIFPPMTSDRLYSVLEGIQKFTKNLILSSENAQRLRRIFDGVFATFDIAGQVIASVVSVLVEVGKMLLPVGETIFEGAAKVGDAIKGLSKWLRESGLLTVIANGVIGILQTFSLKIKQIAESVKKALNLGDIFEPLKKVWKDFGKWINSKGGVVGIVTVFFIRVRNLIKNLDVEKISQAIVDFINKIRNALKGFEGLKDFIGKIFNAIVSFIQDPLGTIEKIKQKIKEMLSSLGDIIRNGFEKLGEGLSLAIQTIKKYAGPIVKLIQDSGLLKIAVAVAGIVTALRIFKKFDISKIIKSVVSGIQAISGAIAKKLKSEAFLKVAGAIGILVAAIYVLTKLDPNRINDALAVIAILFIELIAGVGLLSKAMGGDAAGGVKKIGGFLSLALGLFVIVGVMQKLLGFELDDIVKSLLRLGGILVILGGFARIAGGNFRASSGVGLLLTAIALQGFILAMLELSVMPLETVEKGLTELGIILLEIAGFSRLAGSSLKVSNGVALLLTALSLQGFVLAILEISNMKPEKAIGGIIALGAVLFEIGVFMRLAGSVTSANSKKGIFKSRSGSQLQQGVGILAIAASMILFAHAIQELGEMDTGVLVKGVVALGVVLFELKGLMKNAEGVSLGAGFGMAVIITSLFTLIPLLQRLSKIPDIQKVGIGFGAAIAGLGLGLEKLGKMKFTAGLSAAANFASFAIVASLVIAVIETAAGFVAKIPGIEGFLDGATSVLTQVGEAIGGFIRGLFTGGSEGNAETLSSRLENFGTSLSNFWINASPFIEGVKGLGEDALTGIGNLASAILKLTGGELLDSLASWVSGGEQNLARFGSQLALAAPNIATFANTVGTINKDILTNATDAITALATIDISRSGGWLQTVIGEKDFANFGTQLATMAPGLVDFAGQVAGINVSDCENAAKAIQTLANIDVPNTGGIWQTLAGENDLGNFGSNLGALGSGIAAFSFATKGVNADDISKIEPAIPAIQQLASLDVSNTGGAFQWLVGINDLGNFGNDMQTLGTGLQNFGSGISDINVEQFTGVVSQLQALSDFSMGLTGNLTYSIGDFATAMEVLGGIDFEPLLSSFTQYSADFAEQGKTFGASLVNALTENIYKATSPTNALNVLITSMQTEVEGKTQSYFQIGQALITNLTGGIDAQKYTIKTKVLDAITVGLTAINASKVNFQNSGANLGAGLVTGLKSKVGDITNAAKMLAHSANTAFRNASQIKSPSRVMAENGRYFVQGFIEGLQNETNSAEEAAADIGIISADALTSAVAMVQAMMNSEGDLSPAIRPVLDLSAVQSGAGEISSMLGQTQTIGLGGFQNPFIAPTLNTIGSNMNPLGEETVSTDNDDVVMAIQTLGDQFETLKEAVANMKLVMESGAVVGQIKYEIDRQLGRMAELKERGI